MNIVIREETVDHHYTIWYGSTDEAVAINLGDIYFEQGKSCRVRFYGWFCGVPLEGLATILNEIEKLNKIVVGRKALS